MANIPSTSKCIIGETKPIAKVKPYTLIKTKKQLNNGKTKIKLNLTKLPCVNSEGLKIPRSISVVGTEQKQSATYLLLRLPNQREDEFITRNVPGHIAKQILGEDAYKNAMNNRYENQLRYVEQEIETDGILDVGLPQIFFADDHLSPVNSPPANNSQPDDEHNT